MLKPLDRFEPAVDSTGKPKQVLQIFSEEVAALAPIIGTGSPEGIYEAKAGRMYFDSAGETLYFKKLDSISGERRNGWVISSSGSGGGSLTEAEIDFGLSPVRSKKFTVVDGAVTAASKIIVSPSGNVGTGRVGDDWEWDSISFAAKAGTGSFTISAHASGRIRGNRKVYYSVG